ncbi:MAG: hypothetical protein M0Z54_08875 [Thermaerobacter sp.]|nr:hypothetical protein [Thermaerobacter sp.]
MMSVAIRTPDPAMEVRADRRQFSTAYTLRPPAEADTCTEPVAMGAWLRREGWYSSHLTMWRPQPALVREHARLRHERARAQDDWVQACEVRALQRAVSALGVPRKAPAA